MVTSFGPGVLFREGAGPRGQREVMVCRVVKLHVADRPGVRTATIYSERRLFLDEWGERFVRGEPGTAVRFRYIAACGRGMIGVNLPQCRFVEGRLEGETDVVVLEARIRTTRGRRRRTLYRLAR